MAFCWLHSALGPRPLHSQPDVVFKGYYPNTQNPYRPCPDTTPLQLVTTSYIDLPQFMTGTPFSRLFEQERTLVRFYYFYISLRSLQLRTIMAD
jgi:hypothetical protein